MSPRGPRPGGEDTRADILLAARAEFAAKGYDASSVRSIARSAAVDPALVHHYFDGKRGLFSEVVAMPEDPARVVAAILDGPREQIGERAARTFFSLWDDPQRRERFVAVVRSTVSEAAAAQMMREFLSREMLGRVAAGLDVDRAPLRASLAAGHLIGIALLRYVIGFEGIAKASTEELVVLVAPALQYYLSGTGPLAAGVRLDGR